MPRKNPAAVALGKLGRSKNTDAQKAAARANGRKGGRPKKLQEHEAHVAKQGREAWCGVILYQPGWWFQDAEHARLALKEGNRMSPCPDCMNAIGDAKLNR
jgi:hypothetical protein